MIHIFKMINDVVLNSRQTDYLRECLPKSVFFQALKYYRWQDRQAHLGGRYLLFEGLKRLYSLADILSEMRYTEYGRPYLPVNIDFNISHSGQLILCAMSDKYKIGIDIEKIQAININDFRGQFSDLQFIAINQSNEKYREFYKYWTIKEAVAKADGRGTSINLNNILINKNASLDGRRWFISEVKVLPEYIAHLAVNSVITDAINYHWVTIPEF